MQAIYHDKANEGGVYRIINLTTGKFYYGSTYRFQSRYQSHKATLEADTHRNTYLLNEYRKHGPENFVFEVIEVVVGEVEDRIAAEQVYLDKYYDNQKQCLNLRKNAHDSRTGKKAIEPPNPLTDGRFRKPSEELLEKRGQAIRKAKDNPESKAKARANCQNGLWKDHSANITLTHKDTGEVVHVTTSLRQFAANKGISYKALHLMTRGKTKSSGGWVIL